MCEAFPEIVCHYIVVASIEIHRLILGEKMKVIRNRFGLVLGLVVVATSVWTTQVRGDLYVFASNANASVTVTSQTSSVPQIDNNNFIGLSPNTVDLGLDITGIGGLDKADLVFTPFLTNGTTEYTSNTWLTNSSGVPWDSFSLIIGDGWFDGVVDTFVPFSASAALANFDYPDYDSPLYSDMFTNTMWNGPHSITFFGGIVNPGQTVLVRFPVDVPINQGFTTFRGVITTVPEPNTLTLFAVAGFVIQGTRRRRVRAGGQKIQF